MSDDPIERVISKLATAEQERDEARDTAKALLQHATGRCKCQRAEDCHDAIRVIEATFEIKEKKMKYAKAAKAWREVEEPIALDVLWSLVAARNQAELSGRHELAESLMRAVDMLAASRGVKA